MLRASMSLELASLKLESGAHALNENDAITIHDPYLALGPVALDPPSLNPAPFTQKKSASKHLLIDNNQEIE